MNLGFFIKKQIHKNIFIPNFLHFLGHIVVRNGNTFKQPSIHDTTYSVSSIVVFRFFQKVT